MADTTHAGSPLFQDSALLLTARGGEAGGGESKFLIKGGHYTSEDVLSITSHPRQPTTAKTLPCKSKSALAQGHASAGRSRSPPRGDGRIRSEPPSLPTFLFAPPAPPRGRSQGFSPTPGKFSPPSAGRLHPTSSSLGRGARISHAEVARPSR